MFLFKRHLHLESLMWSIPVIFAGLADVGGAIVACWCLQECHCYYWCSLGQGQNLISFTSLESDFPRNTQLSLRHGTARSSLCRPQPRWLLTVCIWYQRPAGLSSSCAVFSEMISVLWNVTADLIWYRFGLCSDWFAESLADDEEIDRRRYERTCICFFNQMKHTLWLAICSVKLN